MWREERLGNFGNAVIVCETGLCNWDWHIFQDLKRTVKLMKISNKQMSNTSKRLH